LGLVYVRRFFFHLFVAGHFFGAVQPASAETVEMLINTDFSPYIDSSSPNGGLFTDIVRTSFAAVDVDVTLRVMPWKRALLHVERGMAVGTFSWGRNVAHNEEFFLSKPIFMMADVIMTRLPEFRTAEDLEILLQREGEKSICLPLGWTLAPTFERLIGSGKLRRTNPPHIQSCLEALVMGRVDITFAPRLIAAQGLMTVLAGKNFDPDTIRAIRTLENLKMLRSTTHALFTRSSKGEKYLSLFNEGLDVIVENGEYLAIVDRHLKRFPAVERQTVLNDLIQAGILPK